MKRKRNGRILLDNRFIKFPLYPVDLLKNSSISFKMGIFHDNTLGKIRALSKAIDESNPSFEQYMYQTLGRTICERFYFPYFKKISGLNPAETHSIQAKKRIANNSIGKLVKKVVSNLLNSKNENKNFFYYFEQGFGQFVKKYAEAATSNGAKILTNAYATRINKNGSKTGIDVVHQGTKQTLEADIVFSTIPVTKTALLIGIEDQRVMLSYRAMLLVYLVIDLPQFTGFDAHYLPERNFFISRISEPKNYSLVPEPEDKTGICLEIPTEPDSELVNMSQEVLVSKVREQLREMNLPHDFKLLGFKKVFLPNAYPQYRLTYRDLFEELSARLAEFGSVINLGRQGLFVHDNTHHTLDMAYSAADCFTGTWDRERWREHLKDFEKNVVED